MGAKLRLENQTANDLRVQVELTGVTKTVPPLHQVVIDTDFDQGEEIHVESFNSTDAPSPGMPLRFRLLGLKVLLCGCVQISVVK